MSRRLIRAAGIALTTALIAIPATAFAGNSNPGVLPSDGRPHGAAYAEWGARWWQWSLSAPAPVNPLLDASGGDCAYGQTGHVWFLAGMLGGGSTARTCTVPTGTALFFPVLNRAFIATEPEETEQYAHDEVRMAVDLYDVSLMGVEVYGRSIDDLAVYRAHSPTFFINLPDDNIFGVPAGIYGPSAADGYWLMHHGLPPGQHTLHIHGVFPNGMVLDVTYNLTVASH